MEIVGKIFIYLFVFSLVVFFVGIACMAIYYTTYGFWERLRWRCRRRKSDYITSISMPISSINEESLKHTTAELDRRAYIRLPNRMHMIKTITMSTDKKGNCFVTLWYKEKRASYVKESYSRNYDNPLSNWQI